MDGWLVVLGGPRARVTRFQTRNSVPRRVRRRFRFVDAAEDNENNEAEEESEIDVE